MNPRELPRRSCLSAPATDTIMLAGGLKSDADTVFFDLEDSVPEGKKEQARVHAKQMAPRKPPNLCLGLRVNAWSTKWCHRDLIEVVGDAGKFFDYVILPKAESAREVAAVCGLLAQIEADRGIEHQVLVEPIIESGAGLLYAYEIVSADPRVFSLVFAPQGLDFSADMHIYPDAPADYVNATSVMALAAARARGITLVDGPYFALYDLDGLRVCATTRFKMGFDGKWAIHPGQIPVINEAFSPSNDATAGASAVMDSLSQAATDGRGATVLGGEMLDVASARLAQVTLDRQRMQTSNGVREGDGK